MHETCNGKSRREKFEGLRAEGQSVRQASATVGVAASTGYAWASAQRQKSGKWKPAAKGNAGFARLVRQSEVRTLLELEVAGVVIRVPSAFNADALVELIHAVRRSA